MQAQLPATVSPLIGETAVSLDFRARTFKKEILAVCEAHGLTIVPVPDPNGFAHAVLAIIPNKDTFDIVQALMPGRWKTR